MGCSLCRPYTAVLEMCTTALTPWRTQASRTLRVPSTLTAWMRRLLRWMGSAAAAGHTASTPAPAASTAAGSRTSPGTNSTFPCHSSGMGAGSSTRTLAPPAMRRRTRAWPRKPEPPVTSQERNPLAGAFLEGTPAATRVPDIPVAMAGGRAWDDGPGSPQAGRHVDGLLDVGGKARDIVMDQAEVPGVGVDADGAEDLHHVDPQEVGAPHALRVEDVAPGGVERLAAMGVPRGRHRAEPLAAAEAAATGGGAGCVPGHAEGSHPAVAAGPPRRAGVAAGVPGHAGCADPRGSARGGPARAGGVPH